MKTINIRKENFTPVHVLAEDALLEGQPVLRVVKKDKIDIYDENTYAKVNGLQFHNGIIEVKLLSVCYRMHRILQEALSASCSEPIQRIRSLNPFM